MGENLFPKKVVDNSTLPESGVKLIQEFEGFSNVAYPDPHTGEKPFTIGWGSTRKMDGSPFKLGEKISTEDANKLFYYQLEKDYYSKLKNLPYWEEMNEEMQGSLLSFAYNLGAGFYNAPGFFTISYALRLKEWNNIPKVLYLYRNPGTSVEAGLARRRKAEGDLWARGLKKLT